MTTYRVETIVTFRQSYILEAEDDEQAAAIVLSESINPIVSEALAGSETIVEVEEIT